MKKRLLASLLSISMLLGSGMYVVAEEAVEANNDNGEIITLTVGTWSADESARLKAAFEGTEEALGIAVEFLEYPSDSDFWNNIPAQIAAGTAPDIIACGFQ